MTPFEALYGSILLDGFEVGESSLLGPEIIYEDKEKVWVIRDWLKTTYSWLKSYADNRRRDIEFEIGDHVYLMI